jgi:hypothetical protein
MGPRDQAEPFESPDMVAELDRPAAVSPPTIPYLIGLVNYWQNRATRAETFAGAAFRFGDKKRVDYDVLVGTWNLCAGWMRGVAESQQRQE